MGLGTIILAGVVLVVVAAAFAGSIAWVWRDAERRGQPGFIVAVLVAFLFWPLSLIVWLAARPALPSPGGTATPGRGERGCFWALLVVVIIALIPIGVGMFLPFYLRTERSENLVHQRSRATHHRDPAESIAVVRAVAAAYLQYRDAHGQPPKTLGELGFAPEQFPAHAWFELLPGTEASDIIVRQDWAYHDGKGGAIAFGDGSVAWVNSPCKPIRLDVVKAAVEKLLRDWFDRIEKSLLERLPEGLGDKSVRVEGMKFDARANRYHLEVHWQVQGRDQRSLIQLDSIATHTGLSQYQGMFEFVVDGISNPINVLVQVDELMKKKPLVEGELQ
jgi:flagellar basal body-associated protein FliL